MGKRICPFCKEYVQEDAILCKYCRSELSPLPPKKTNWKVFGLVLLIFMILISIGIIFSDDQSDKTPVPLNTPIPSKNPDAVLKLPKFKVVAQDLTTLTILVSKDIKNDQLETLISGFRTARERNILSRFIPATTKGGIKGDYAIIWIFVFSEPDWSTADKLKRFINMSALSETDKQFEKEYTKHIKAEYYYSDLVGDEYGSLGYDDGVITAPNYKKLF